jgi:hypothetical protein
MISPKLLDFLPFFFLISSPLGTADFLMLLELSGDGYSLLCSNTAQILLKLPASEKLPANVSGAFYCTLYGVSDPVPKDIFMYIVLIHCMSPKVHTHT